MSTPYITELFSHSKHITKGFYCGVKELDAYIKTRAGQEMKKNISVVYILRRIDSDEVSGYFSLSSSSIALQEIPVSLQKKLPRYPSVPVILLGRLAVESAAQKKGIGEYLLMDALKRSYYLSKEIAAFAVVVVVKDEKIQSFYEKYGFKRFAQIPLKLYLPMRTIGSLIR